MNMCSKQCSLSLTLVLDLNMDTMKAAGKDEQIEISHSGSSDEPLKSFSGAKRMTKRYSSTTVYMLSVCLRHNIGHISAQPRKIAMWTKKVKC